MQGRGINATLQIHLVRYADAVIISNHENKTELSRQ